ncbi:RNA polymerase sigma factor FliA [Dechloromonas sp. ZY10]|uniref:RNA polymerase sigma factor FliA n=1 Tax=Dechloromonas aquae TaxID=2664436 RepID=UPI003529305B
MYTSAGQPDKKELVQRYIPLVKRVAHYLLLRLPASVMLDDLVQNGMLGLLDALDRYEDSYGAQFETYASQRIRGAMLDGLRENDWLPRNLRKEMRKVESAILALEHQLGRSPSEGEIAEQLNISLPQYQKTLQEARGHQLVYLEDFRGEDDSDYLEHHLSDDAIDPAGIFENKSLRQQLTSAIDQLPERERLLMALYYEEELNLREIGAILGVTESRVCQLHSQAVSRLRAHIAGTLPKKVRQRKDRTDG